MLKSHLEKNQRKLRYDRLFENQNESKLSYKSLKNIFTQSEQKRKIPLVGLEHEKISFHIKDGSPVLYFGKNGIHQFLMHLCTRYGWDPIYSHEFLIAVKRKNAQVTIEPGGQIELSGSPFDNLCDLKCEFENHLKEVTQAGLEMGIGFSSLAFHPDRNPKNVPFVPKSRYPLMGRFFNRVGKRGIYMMNNTATAQVNLDFSNETEAFEKMRAGQLASPYVTAIFANSPFEDGKLTSWKSRRYFTWLDVAQDRCGLLPFVYRDNASYNDYVDWALNATLFGIERQDEYMPCGVLSFGEFLENGFNGFYANEEDWLIHLGTLFPEVRLKKTVELRGADSGGMEHTMALTGLWRGLLDDPAARRLVNEHFQTPRDPVLFQTQIAQHGLRACAQNRDIQEECFWLARTAKMGLYNLGEALADKVLEPLFSALSQGICPADEWHLGGRKITSTLDILLQTSYHL